MRTHSLTRSSKFIYSSPKNPCPVCGRVKDSDCRWNAEGVCHCRTYAKEHLRVGSVIQGSDGGRWAYLGDSDGGRWAMFRPHKERERFSRKPKLTPSAKRPASPAKQTPKPTVAPPTVAKKPRPAGERDFIYHDADGYPVIKVRRTDYGDGEKTFSQFRWENSQWVARLTEQVTQRVRLYRIAEARALSERTGRPIFLVEGESCVERLMELGVPATTSIGGAGKWTRYGGQNYLQDLRNFRVILCPDADVPGLNHMLDIEKSLRQNGIEVAGWLLAPPDAPWENLPEGGGLDVVDWLDSGATAEEILDSIRVALPDYLADEDETTDLAIEDSPSRKKSVVKALVKLALQHGSLWHDSSGMGWIDFYVDGVLQTARIRSKRFRDFLSFVLWEQEERTFGSEAWSETVVLLEGLARFRRPEREVFLRVGKHNENIYIDLGTDDWRIIRVSPSGWEVIPYINCPIRFYRPDCQLPLPIPTREGSLDDLWQLLNVREADRPLVVGWLLSCLTPDGSKPILVFSGEKGSGKSSAATLLKRLADPTKVSKLSTVGDSRTVAVAALNRWVLCYDNLTHLSVEQQDLLCCISTGAGYSHRTLYTDLEETFLEFRRPQILTGIDLVPTRSDLLDRCLLVRLERISEEDRLTEEELETLTADLLPGIYGALLDLLVTALRNLPETQPAKLPRLADFAQLCLAAGIPGFQEAYAANLETGCQAAVEANPLAEGILSLLDACDGNWRGTSTELVRKLQELDPTSREFQKLSARSVGRKLASSLKGDLAAVGVKVTQGRTGSQRYLILSRVVEPQTPTPSLDKEEEEQSPPIALPSVTPEKNNGTTAVPSTPANPEVSTRSEVEEDSHTSRWRWNSLLNACVKAGVSHLQVREVLAQACGCSKEEVDKVSLTREQYRRALNYLANYQNGATAAAPTNGKAHDFSSPPITSTQTRLPVSPPSNSNGHNPHNSHSLDSAEIGLPLTHEGIPPWLWEG